MTGPATNGPAGHPGLVAVVTGASRGLGAGMAEAFAAAGISLGLCARTRPPVPDRAVAVSRSVDVTDAGALDRFAAEVVDGLGRIDLWINNAGVVAPIGPLADADPAAVRELVDVNVLGVVHGTSSFARHVRSRPGRGVLVNLSSGAATDPSEGWAPYCSSKAAVEMITAVVALEERPHGLRAYALSPGVVDTEMQVLIRATPKERFPTVGRFLQRYQEDRFNSPAWVAHYILDELVERDPGRHGEGGPGPHGHAAPVRLRVPEHQPSADPPDRCPPAGPR